MSYMSAHVLLNLSNELRNNFRNDVTSLVNSINTGPRMLGSIYHMTLIKKLIKNSNFSVITPQLYHLLRNVIMDVIT